MHVILSWLDPSDYVTRNTSSCVIMFMSAAKISLKIKSMQGKHGYTSSTCVGTPLVHVHVCVGTLLVCVWD